MARSDKDQLDNLCEVAERMGAEGWGTWLESRRPLWADFESRHAEVVAWDAEVDGDLDEMNDYLYYLSERDGVCDGNFTVTAGAAVGLTASGEIRYRIGGVEYSCVLQTEITLEDNGTISDGKYGAWRILIDKAGTVTTQDPKGSGAQAFTAEEDAMLCLAQRAVTAGTVELGYFTILASTGDFNIGTDGLSTEGATVVRYVRMPRIDNGLSASLGGSVGASDITWTIGSVDAKANGLNLAQIAALNSQPFDDSDTIALNCFGGHLIVTDLATTGLYALGSDGIAGSVTSNDFATAVAVGASLDAIQAALPTHFTVVSRIVVENNVARTFTYNSDDIAGDDGTATITDETFGTFDRTDMNGTGVQNDAPVIPMTVLASVPSSLTASNARSLELPGT